MRISSVITVLLAIILAGVAGFLAQHWLEQQRRLGQPTQTRQAPQATIVVASRPLRFGTELSEVNLREIEWPTTNLPAGAFAKIVDLVKPGERRLALAPIEPNEPVLGPKITGPGQRATLSSLISEGMKAITIRVNDVNGVAGFVLPGDRIDVMLTRKVPDGSQLATEVLLQDVRVLGIDQNADERQDKAILVKAVTIEVTIDDAQRVVLASSVGSLSLALRAAGSSGRDATGRITPSDLTGFRGPQPPAPVTASEEAPVIQRAEEPVERSDRSLRPFGVTRSVKRFEYSVPSDDDRSRTPVRLKRVSPPEPGKAGVEGGTGVPNKQPGPNSKGPGTAPQSWLNSWSVRTLPAPLGAPTAPVR